jgi:hypothetical protein
MQEAEAESIPVGRVSSLVATRLRWLSTTAAVAGIVLVLAEVALVWTHSPRTLASFALPLMATFAAIALLVLALLRAEESRLAREIRTARSCTAVLRGMMARRRLQQPFFARMFSTGLGTAALLVADGNRSAALDALAAVSPWMHSGRLEALRAVVDADLERASGTSAGLDRCVARLRSMPRTGHREADLYAIHVLVKAVLEQGNGEIGFELATRLADADDEDERVYATWLRVWFDLDSEPDARWPPLAEGHTRRAALVARAHGAEKLVGKLEALLLAIARPERQE